MTMGHQIRQHLDFKYLLVHVRDSSLQVPAVHVTTPDREPL